MNLPRSRAGAQLLVERDPGGPASVAERFLAVQGQAFGPARWALGLRSLSTSLREVDALFDDATLVRTWTMRGTLHVVPARDASMMLAVTAERQRRLAASVMRRDGLDDRTMATAFRALESALERAGSLERKDAMDAMEAEGIDTGSGRGYQLIREAALAGIVVWGPVRRAQQALVPAGEWLPRTDAMDRDEALARILVRYLRCRAPATLRDFAWWLGIGLTDARRAWAAAGDAILPSECGGELLEAFGLTQPPVPEGTTALLPAFDEYLLGYRDRSAVLREGHVDLVATGGNGVFQPLIVVDGLVAGTWRADTLPGGVHITFSEFSPLRAATRERLQRDAERYAAFLGMPLLTQDSASGY